MNTPVNFTRGQLVLTAALLAIVIASAGCARNISRPKNNRRALVVGRGLPITDPDGSPSHAQKAKDNFLRLVNNPSNDPNLGWTCDLSYDLLVTLKLDPTNTPLEVLFEQIRAKKLGHRIVMQNGARGATLPVWGKAVDSGMMPFAPQGNNDPGTRFDDPPGLFAAVSVAGGVTVNQSSYGPGVEFIDALPNGDAAQSWANQVVAAKFAQVLDQHPKYNIWDARSHLRQTATEWQSGWNERDGYGRPNAETNVSRLSPAPPLQFTATASSDRRRVVFTWRNFKQSDYIATVIARGDGRIIYRGHGTSFTWTSDVEGSETFTYWSRNKYGQTSRIESYQVRTVNNLLR